VSHFSSLSRQFFWFAVVGVIGFVVDAGLLDFLVHHQGGNPYSGRGVSFLAAATTTWWLNRWLTFRSQQRLSIGEWVRYVALMTLGAFVNIGVYSCIVWSAGSARQILWMALAAGTLCGMGINFLTARWMLYRPA
jgi:putative flippase GtrA